MNSLMDALERAGDVPPATETEAWRIDVGPKLEIQVDAPPGPIRAMSEDADSGPVVSAEPGFGDSRRPEERGEWHLDPIRATRDGAGAGPVSEAGHDFGDPRGPEDPGVWHPDPIRATRDGAGAGPVSGAEHDFGDPRGPEDPGVWHPDPIRATRDGAGAGPVSEAGHDFGDPRGLEDPGVWHPDPIRATRDGAGAGPVSEAGHDFGDPHGPEELGERHLATTRTTRDGIGADAVATAADEFDEPPEPAALPESTRRSFDPRTLPPRRGAIRTAAVLLPLLAVIGAGAAGGYLFWKTQLVRPALVRHLPSMPVAAVDFTPAPDANAATGESERAVAGAPIPRQAGAGTSVAGGAVEPSPGFADARGPVPAARGAEAPPVHGVGSAPDSVGKDEARTAAAGAPTPDGAKGPRKSTAAGLLVADSSRTPAVSGDSSPDVLEDSPSSRAAGIPATAHPTTAHPTTAHPTTAHPTTAHPTAAHPTAAHPTAAHPTTAHSTTAHSAAARQEPPASDPMPPAATDVPAGTVDPPETAKKHAGTDPPQGARAGIAIRKRVRTDYVAASLERAYEAYRIGDAASASEAYRVVLEDEPRNRDALLGLAATAARAGRRDAAAAHYARVLASHPADAVARAGLIAVDERDPARSESALKALLRREPRAAHLHFGLGNVYAAQSRWAEAQRAYFDACRFDGDNADYAYNLAVSLDHLAQRRGALDLYRKALALSQGRPTAFDTVAVLARIRDIDPLHTAGVAPAASHSMTAGAARAGSAP